MISKEQVKHIAKLAKLRLAEGEDDKHARELSKVMDYIDKLSEVNTDNIEATAQVTGLTNCLRSDVAIDWSDDERQKTLAAAELSETGLIKVKKIL